MRRRIFSCLIPPWIERAAFLLGLFESNQILFKYFAHKLLENTGVRKTELFCYYQPEARFIISDECASNINDVLQILRRKSVHSCVIKTTESSHGDNVLVISRIIYQEQDAFLTCFDGKEYEL